jgi:Aspartyl aminopeptidase
MGVIEELMGFLDSSLTCYHAVCEVEKRLLQAGFTRLSERKAWELGQGRGYYVIRNDSSIMAFRVPECDVSDIKGFHIFAAHSDSPAFKLKECPEMTKEGGYVSLNTEKYGGMILSSWLDRPLTIAGRVCVEEGGEIVSYPVKLKDNTCLIPNLAIHLNRDMNNGIALNPQTDMLPLLMMHSENESKAVNIKSMLARALNGQYQKHFVEDDILASDLFAENSQKAVLAGICDEFIMSARFDDLACVFAGTEAMLTTESGQYMNVLAVFDNEEVGSLTRQGADSTFLRDVLENISDGLQAEQSLYRIWKADSFLLSADNAHACHPNQGAKSDPVNRPYLNGGIVLKYHGGQKYATDAYSAAVVKKLCKEQNIPYQIYTNRSDIAGGSTLGNLLMAQVSVPAADIGLPQLAMHSAYETGGTKDITYMVKLAKAFYRM